RTKSGEIKEVIFSVVMIPGTSQSLVSLLDITEQRRLEERLIQAQKMESVGTLAGGVAHDFNNLLMAVLGNVSILKEQPDTDALQKRLRHIEQYVNAGIDLTRQLLGFARGGKYDPRPVSLNELVEKSASLFGRTRKEVCMHFSLEENVWTVQADPSQMEQVLLNLYVNAWQAMTGGGDIFINSKNMVLEEKDVKPWKAVPGKYVRLSVTDTGCGMDEATMQQVFDPFFTTKQKERGTGLGLASVYGIVQNHGGFITVYSLPDQGSTFNIYLPVAEQEAEALLRSGVSEDEGFFYGCETILLVDDEQIVLDVCKDMLEGLGYRVYPADSGSKAIRLYREKTEEIDAVLLDFTMPEVSGEETFRQLQAIDPGVRVLVSSGFSLNRQVQNLLEQGVAGFIQKPFNLRGLSRKLQEILK
ncbi:MAG TPA: ATP-binding protein, partial [Desulfosalsimonadaceae bacterium]|nr:ATP-binding protein [Desulfosalsimonadaceae bacterium]